jgi:hypothetical protein
MDQADAFQKANRIKVDLLRIDLDTCVTFVKTARESLDKETVARNRRNARQAYDSVVHLMSAAVLTQIEEENVKTKLEHLKNALADLDEPF